MADGVRDSSQTGRFSRADVEPQLKAEQKSRKIKPVKPDDAASTTGIMPIYREPADESAVGDEDKPAE